MIGAIMPDDADIILGVLKSNGESGQFVDARKSKKKVAKKHETLTEWSDVKCSSAQLKDDFEKWTGVDFRLYFSDKYQKRYKTTANFPRPVFSYVIGKLRVLLARYLKQGDQVGNSTVKQYIDYYVERQMDYSMDKNKEFWTPNRLCDDIPLKQFTKMVVNGVISATSTTISSKDSPAECDLSGIEAAAKLGKRYILTRYGILITTMYLAGRDMVDISTAAARVGRGVSEVVTSNRQFWKDIRRSTEKYSPYPTWMTCNMRTIIDAIPMTSIDLDFDILSNDNDHRFDFLRNK